MIDLLTLNEFQLVFSQIGPSNYSCSIKIINVHHALLQRRPALVIGADTVVAMDNKIFEKPKDKDHALEMLSRLVINRNQ